MFRWFQSWHFKSKIWRADRKENLGQNKRTKSHLEPLIWSCVNQESKFEFWLRMLENCWCWWYRFVYSKYCLWVTKHSTGVHHRCTANASGGAVVDRHKELLCWEDKQKLNNPRFALPGQYLKNKVSLKEFQNSYKERYVKYTFTLLWFEIN